MKLLFLEGEEQGSGSRSNMWSAQLVAGTSSRHSSPFDSHKTGGLGGHAMRQPSFSTNVTCLSGFRVESRSWRQNTQSSGSVNVLLVWRVPRQKEEMPPAGPCYTKRKHNLLRTGVYRRFHLLLLQPAHQLSGGVIFYTVCVVLRETVTAVISKR